MATVAVGDQLHDEWLLLRESKLARKLRAAHDRESIHSVHLDTRDLVTAGVELRVHRAALSAGTHTVLVVLADKHARQAPELGHVERLKHLALVGRTVTVQVEGGMARVLVLLHEGQTGTDGHLCTDNTVATVEGRCVHVHGSTLAPGHTATAAEQLRKHALDRATTLHGERVAAVRGDHVVIRAHCELHTDGHGLLTDRQVAEAADILLLVELVRRNLHAAHLNHVAVDIHQLLARHLDLELRPVDLVAVERLWAERDLERLRHRVRQLTRGLGTVGHKVKRTEAWRSHTGRRDARGAHRSLLHVSRTHPATSNATYRCSRAGKPQSGALKLLEHSDKAQANGPWHAG